MASFNEVIFLLLFSVIVGGILWGCKADPLVLLIVNAEAYHLFTVKSNLTFWMHCWTSIYLDSGELSNYLVQNLICKFVHSSQNISHFVHCLTTILSANWSITRRLSVLSFSFIKLWSNWTKEKKWLISGTKLAGSVLCSLQLISLYLHSVLRVVQYLRVAVHLPLWSTTGRLLYLGR
jgi:hypothetical protein